MGLLGKSSAMLSDAVHSISDVISTVIVISALKWRQRVRQGASLRARTFGMCGGNHTCHAAVYHRCRYRRRRRGNIMQNNYEAYRIPGGILLAAAIISIW